MPSSHHGRRISSRSSPGRPAARSGAAAAWCCCNAAPVPYSTAALSAHTIAIIACPRSGHQEHRAKRQVFRASDLSSPAPTWTAGPIHRSGAHLRRYGRASAPTRGLSPILRWGLTPLLMPYEPGKSPAAAGSFIVRFVSVDAQPGQRARPYAGWRTFLRFEVFMSALIGGGLALGWLLTGAHGQFWPVWAWFGLAVPIWYQGAVLWGLRAPRNRRFMALHLSVSFAIAVMLLVIWMLAGFHYFFPIWPILGLAVPLGVHAWIVRNRTETREQALANRVDVLTRTRRGALDIQAAELQRIERDLHDGAQARLVSVAMSLGLAEQMLQTEPRSVAGLLAEARSTTLTALDDLRMVMRGIHPPVLADRGLDGAIRALALDLAGPVTVGGTIPAGIPAPVESAAYFAVAECLANVVKHSAADRAGVDLGYRDGVLSVVVRDDGVGSASLATGSGLRGVARRLEVFDGTLTLTSPAGGPTVVRLEVPCELSSPKI